MERRLAVVLAADVAGYSRLVAADEEGTLATLRTYRTTIAELIAEHGGRIFGSAGDSVIAEFASAVQGVRAAVAIQRALSRRNADLPPERRMEFRIGLNLGDVVIDGSNLLGDGVDVAAWLQEVARPAGICISGALREHIVGKLDFPLVPLGERSLKNIPRAVPVHGVDWRRDDPVAAGALGGPLPPRRRLPRSPRRNGSIGGTCSPGLLLRHRTSKNGPRLSSAGSALKRSKPSRQLSTGAQGMANRISSEPPPTALLSWIRIASRPIVH